MASPLKYIMRRLYDDWACAYSPAAWIITGGLYHRWTFAAEDFLLDGPVLEVGCGGGRLLARLAAQGREVIGVDSSAGMVQAARRYLKGRRLKGRVICADARKLPLANESVSTIINAFPMPYVHEEATWREYLRVLRRGGRWVIVAGPQPDRFHPRLIGWYAFRLLEWWGRERAGRSSTTIPGEFFPLQRCELVPVGPTQVAVAILEKENEKN